MSRKLFILYIVLIFSTFVAFAPPITVWIFTVCRKQVPPLMLLTSTEWVSIITLVVSTYFGSNVWEKHVALSNRVNPQDLDRAVMQANNANGQQVNVQVDVNQVEQDPDRESIRNAFKHGEI